MKYEIKRSLDLLTSRERKIISAFTLAQVFAGLLDVLGLIGTGFVAAISVERNMQGQVTRSLVIFLSQQKIEFYTWESLLRFVIVFTLSLLTLKSLLSILLSRFLLKSLAKYLLNVSNAMLNHILKMPSKYLQKMSRQNFSYAFTEGLMFLIIGIIGNFMAAIVEVSMLIAVFSLLFILEPFMAITVTLFFLLLAGVVSAFIGKKVKLHGNKFVSENNQSRTYLTDAILLNREMKLLNKFDFFTAKFAKSRKLSAESYWELSWIQQIPKYVMELGIIFGVCLITFVNWLNSGSNFDVIKIAIFMMASTRIIPSILRFQNVFISLREISGRSRETLEFIDELNFEGRHENIEVLTLENSHQKPPIIELRNVTFSFDDSNTTLIQDLNLRIDSGSEIVITGPSGSGKSTLCEIILGLISPDKGTVSFDNQPVQEWLEKTRAKISYMPQNPHFFAGTIRDNVSLGYNPDGSNDEQIWNALKDAQIADFVRNLPVGLDTTLNDGGAELSGGQKQRLGIARALFFNPSIMVIDEGTSAQDYELEQELMGVLESLREQKTIIRVTHRQTSPAKNRQIISLEEGLLTIA